jgi:hypothetical protein
VALSISIILTLFPFFLLDTKKIDVAKTNPEAFIKSERIERLIEISFVIIYTLVYALVFLLLGLQTYENTDLIPMVGNLITPIFLLGSGVLFTFFLSIFEKLVSTLLLFLPDTKRKRLILFTNYFVGNKIRAGARIRTTLDALSNNLDIKLMRKKIHPFKESLMIYNNHLVRKFDFAMRDIEKFYKHVQLSALYDEPKIIAKIKECLASLANLMEKENEKPLEFVKTLRTMIGESNDNPCELYLDLEIEPLHFTKQIKAHSDLLKISLTIISSIIIPLLLNFTNLMG